MTFRRAMKLVGVDLAGAAELMGISYNTLRSGKGRQKYRDRFIRMVEGIRDGLVAKLLE